MKLVDVKVMMDMTEGEHEKTRIGWDRSSIWLQDRMRAAPSSQRTKPWRLVDGSMLWDRAFAKFRVEDVQRSSQNRAFL